MIDWMRPSMRPIREANGRTGNGVGLDGDCQVADAISDERHREVVEVGDDDLAGLAG